MPKRKLWKSPDLVPAIVCKDVPGTAAWLERVFGFRERAGARLTWPGGAIAWIEAGDALFSLTTADALQRQVAGGAVRGRLSGSQPISVAVPAIVKMSTDIAAMRSSG